MSVVGRLKSALGFDERREHSRQQVPRLTVKIDGRKYGAIDWSMGGCRINAPAAALQVKQKVDGQVTLDGADGRGKFIAEIVRVAADGDIGLRWLELSPNIFVAMAPHASTAASPKR
jgi:hypothetical protein